MTAQLPKEIVILISEYATNSCRKCGNYNIRYLIVMKNLTIIERDMIGMLCKRCQKKVIISRNFKELNYHYKMNTISIKINNLNNYILNTLEVMKDYDVRSYDTDYIKIDKKQLEENIKKKIKVEIDKIIDEGYITHRIASKKELFNILYKTKF